MKEPSFIVRFSFIFVPLMIFLFFVFLAGIRNPIMMVILALGFTWMLQAIYRKLFFKPVEPQQNNPNKVQHHKKKKKRK